MTRALGVLLAALSLGAPTWDEPRTLSDIGISLGPELAMTSSGAALATWDGELGPDCAQSPASLTCIHIVEVAARDPSGAWGSPDRIARPGVGARPGVALNDAGRAAVIWVHDIGRDRVVQATYRTGPSQPFPNPSDLSAAVLEVRSHHIGLDGAGNAVAVWAERHTGDFGVAGEIRSAASGTWDAPAVLSTGNVQAGPDLAVTPGGDAFAIWIQGAAVLVAHADLTKGAWDPPVTLSGNGGRGAAVAVDAAGDAVAVWTLGDRPGVEAAARPAGGSWGPTVMVSDVSPFNGVTAPDVALAGDGTAVAVWVGGSSLRASVRGSDGSWSRPLEVGAADSAEPRVSLDSHGNAIALWLHRSRLLAAARPAVAAAWQPAEQLSDADASAPQVATDAVGNGVALWNLRNGDLLPVVTSAFPAAAWTPSLANTNRPSIRGVPRVGRTVTCTRGGWAGTVPIRYAYGWLRKGRLAASGRSYRIRRGDAGARLACRVVAKNAARTLSSLSAPVRVKR